MAKTKSKQLANLLTFTTASIDVVSGSLIPMLLIYIISVVQHYHIRVVHFNIYHQIVVHLEYINKMYSRRRISCTQYIKHKGDTNTLINFTDNRVRLWCLIF